MKTPQIQELLKEISQWPLGEFKYDVKGKPVVLTLEQVLEGSISRVGVDGVKKFLEDSKEYFKEGNSGFSWIEIKKTSYEALVGNEITFFLLDMGAHVAYKDVMDASFSKVVKDNGLTKDFVRWFMNKKGLTEQQVVCDHDDVDQYATDGMFYNSVGTCKKCLMDMNLSFDHYEDLSLLFDAWSKK